MKYRDLGYLMCKQAARLGPGKDSSSISGGMHGVNGGYVRPKYRVPVLKPRVPIPTNSTYNPNAADWMAKWYTDPNRRNMYTFKQKGIKGEQAAFRSVIPAERAYLNKIKKGVDANARKIWPKLQYKPDVPAKGKAPVPRWSSRGKSPQTIFYNKDTTETDRLTTDIHEGIHANQPKPLLKARGKEWHKLLTSSTDFYNANDKLKKLEAENEKLIRAKNRMPAKELDVHMQKERDQAKEVNRLYGISAGHESKMRGISETPTILGESVARGRARIAAGESEAAVAKSMAEIHRIPLYAAQNMLKHLKSPADPDFNEHTNKIMMRPESQNFMMLANKDFPYGTYTEKERKKMTPEPDYMKERTWPAELGKLVHSNPEAAKMFKEKRWIFGDAQPQIIKKEYEGLSGPVDESKLTKSPNRNVDMGWSGDRKTQRENKVNTAREILGIKPKK